MLIIADDKIPFLKGVLEPYSKILYLPGASISNKEVKNADALIVRTRTKVNEKLLKGSKVKAVVSATIGTDHLDISWLEKNNIAWSNAPGCNSGSVKQYIASVLANLVLKGFSLQGKTLGIIGVGNVGSKITSVGEAFGMKVLLNDPPRKEKEPDFPNTDLNVLLQLSDIITFHVPLTHEGPYSTYHLFNDTTLLMVKRGCVLINSSRGEVVDQQALLKGLNTGIINQAILDVWENEPDISLELQNKLLFGTPHIAGYAVDGKANGSAAAVQFLSKIFHWDLDNWYPQNLPSPANMVITFDEKDDGINTQLAKAILKTYDVSEDSRRLTQNPESFEYLRGAYPVRRELHCWTVKMPKECEDLKQRLSLLGFQVKQQ